MRRVSGIIKHLAKTLEKYVGIYLEHWMRMQEQIWGMLGKRVLAEPKSRREALTDFSLG
jgi:hypothetical protein